jgi:hypothetical protein
MYQSTVFSWQDRTRLLKGERQPVDNRVTALFEAAKKMAPAALTSQMLAELDDAHRLAVAEMQARWREREAALPKKPAVAAVADHLADKRVFCSPRKKAVTVIRKMETTGIFVPLSLRAWIEEVGDVNLAGAHPRLCFWEDEGFPGIHADPLMVVSDIFEIEGWLEERGSGDAPATLDVVVGWDAKAKARLTVADEQLDHGYSIAIPDAGADARLKGEPHGIGFVDYLRLAFRWGGFPGWEKRQERPERELKLLTDGLLPI